MKFDFETHLTTQLNLIKQDLDIEANLIVASEQIFAKMKEFTPDTIYVVIKYLSSDIQFEAETTPIQLIIVSEQNGLSKAKSILDKFAVDNNWKVIIDGTTFVKQQYNSPVVLNNFNETTYGYRSSLYLSGTITVMENVVDVRDFTVDGVNISSKLISCSIAYNMQTNTQQVKTQFIANSVKTVSSMVITVIIPMIDSNLVKKIKGVLREDTDGNDNFAISFKLGKDEWKEGVAHTDANNLSYISKTMKCNNISLVTSINQVPSIQIGFIK